MAGPGSELRAHILSHHFTLRLSKLNVLSFLTILRTVRQQKMLRWGQTFFKFFLKLLVIRCFSKFPSLRQFLNFTMRSKNWLKFIWGLYNLFKFIQSVLDESQALNRQSTHNQRQAVDRWPVLPSSPTLINTSVDSHPFSQTKFVNLTTI